MRKVDLDGDFYQLACREVAATDAAAPDVELPVVELPVVDLHGVMRSEALQPAIGTRANPWLTFPRFYHQRGGECDRDFIELRLSVVPPELLHAVCVSFERIYLQGRGDRLSRFTAKTWLHKVANEFKEARQLPARKRVA